MKIIINCKMDGKVPMAFTFFNGEYKVKSGESFEEAKKKLIEEIKAEIAVVVPPQEEIEI